MSSPKVRPNLLFMQSKSRMVATKQIRVDFSRRTQSGQLLWRIERFGRDPWACLASHGKRRIALLSDGKFTNCRDFLSTEFCLRVQECIGPQRHFAGLHLFAYFP
jgi:hypothetical protein